MKVAILWFYPSLNYLTWGNGNLRIYERDNYDTRLTGLGELKYFDDLEAMCRHGREAIHSGDRTPIQVSVNLLGRLGFTEEEVQGLQAAA